MNKLELTIDRENSLPISDQIADQILRAILEGDLDPGERLPPERDLAEQLGVSRGTVKRAYARLVQTEAIDIRQGSGSYVLRNGHVLEQNQKKEASSILSTAIGRLTAIGLSEKEILNLMNLQLLSVSSRKPLRKISIMVVSNNHDILSELEQQLSYLTDASPFLFTLSFLTLDTITSNPDPVQTLLAYDLIIATVIDYPEMLAIAPMLRNKMVEASISPRTRTLMRLSSLPADSRVGVIYRTEIFRNMVVQYLESLDFSADHILCCSEVEYNPASHSENDVNVLVNFNDSPVFRNPEFEARNREFLSSGGQILRFEYQISRESLILIEDQIQRLLEQDAVPADQ